MERIIYRITLDTHKTGVQKTLQGFQTADNMARRIAISLVSGGDSFEIDETNTVAMMYVTTPNATEPSINACTIEDNTIIYDVLPIVEEGITEMQIKLISTSVNGAKRVLAISKFAVEVTESGTDDSNAEQTTTFTALEDAIAIAHGVYNERLLSVEITADCTFKAYYADGTVYENCFIKDAIYNGNAVVAESYAVGGTGTRAGEDTDNAMYYSNKSKSASVEVVYASKEVKELLEEARLLSNLTSFMVNFETGELGYISKSYDFEINEKTGYLEVEGDDAFDAKQLVAEDVEKFIEEKSEDLEYLDIQTSTDTTLRNTKAGGLRLTKMVGNTEQKKLSGKNMIDASGLVASTVNGITFTPVYNSNGGLEYVNVNGTANGTSSSVYTIKRLDLTEVETLILSGCPSGGSASGYYLGIWNSNWGRICTSYGGDAECVVPSDGVLRCQISVSVGTTVNNLKFYPMLRKADITDDTYEPYCGGIASPNPSFPQPLMNVSDCVEMEQGSIATSDGSLTVANNRIRSKQFIPCKEGDNITLLREKAINSRVYFYDSNKAILSTIASTTTTSATHTVPSGASYFKFIFSQDNDFTVDDVGKITLTINGKYVNCIREHGENLFYATVDDFKSGITSGSSKRVWFWLKPNTQYTLSSNAGTYSDGGTNIWFNGDSSFTNGVSLNNPKTITTGEDGSFFIAVRTDNIDNIFANYWIMLNEGNTPEPYEPYKETVAYFLTDEPLRKGDILFKENGLFKVEHFLAEYVFTGQESALGLYEKSNVAERRFALNDATLFAHANYYGIPFSNYFKGVAYRSSDDLAFYHQNRYLVFNDVNSYWADLDSFKAWLVSMYDSGNPLTALYPRATPTIEVLDTESQLALNSLETFDTVTYIEVDSRVKPSEIECEYGASKVGAYTLKSLNNTESNAVKLNAFLEAQYAVDEVVDSGDEPTE